LLAVVLLGALASAVTMALLYVPGVDPSRIYYGTDTRATGLLCGAALAFLWSPGDKYRPSEARHHRLGLPGRSRFRRRWGWTAPLLLDIVGFAALGALVWFCVNLGEFQPFLYSGGFALVGIATTATIMAVVHPHSVIGSRFLGSAPLRWVGVRSYGIYLWHWPVFMVTRPDLDVPIDGLPLLALRLTATVVLADLSYRYIETPIRRGALGRAWRTLREAQGPLRRRLRLQWAGVLVPILASCALLGVAVAQAEPPEKPSYLASMKSVHTVEQSHHASSTAGIVSSGPSLEQEGQEQVKAQTAAKKTWNSGRTGSPAFTGSVSAIGDSVMLGAVGGLQKDIHGLTVVDAEVGLQVYAATHTLRYRRASGQLGDVVIVHLGNNGTFTKEQFDKIMRILSGVDRVVFVNVAVPRAWEDPNNEVIAEGVDRYPNAVLVDWHSASAVRPEIFYKDGYHLRPRGQRLYADLISSYLPEE